MKYFVIALPEKKIIQKIMHVREDLMKKGFAEEDPNIKKLPHVTLRYLTDIEDPIKVQEYAKDFSKLSGNTIQSQVINYDYYNIKNENNKIVAIMNHQPFQNQVLEIDKLSKSFGISENDEYLNKYAVIADHMKIAKKIKGKCTAETKSYVEKALGLYPTIIFDRIVFCSYDCIEKDIISEIKLNWQ